MRPFSSLFRAPSAVDATMARAKALKRENQIHPREVEYLIGELDDSLQHVQGVGRRRRIPGSSYSPSEVTRTAEALRSVLLAVEVVKRTKETTGVPTALRDHARRQLLEAILSV